MKYDIKIYQILPERKQERETIRNLSESQMIVIREILIRNSIPHVVKEIKK